MIETGYGSGGYGYIPAATPAAPLLAPAGDRVAVTPGPDSNRPDTEYAVYNGTLAAYIGADGLPDTLPAWLTREEWAAVPARGLDPVTTFTFAVKARGHTGIETGFGPAAEVTTWNTGTAEIELALTVTKQSSTITAPAFLGAYDAGITLAGKPLAELGFVVERIGGLDMPRAVPDEELVPGDHTWHVWDEYFSPRRIVLDGHLHGSDPDDLRLRLAYFKSFLATFAGSPWRSSAPVSLARADIPGRHWRAFYEAVEEATTLGPRELAASARVRVTMKCPLPFAEADDITRVTAAPATGSFVPLTLGNAPSDAVFTITGPAADPAFAVGDMVFLCDFADGLAFTDVKNEAGTGTFTPPENEPGCWRATETGFGLLVSGTDTVGFAAPGNPADGAWLIRIIPQWHSTARDTDAVLLEHHGDDDNYLRLYWEAAGRRWVFRKRAAGADIEIASTEQAFTSGTPVALGISWDTTNAGGMRLFVDGAVAAQGVDVTPLAASPGTLFLHAGDGTGQPDAVVDLAAGWSRMLAADEMLRLAGDPDGCRNDNAVVAYTGNLDAGDMLVLDSAARTARLLDVSEGARTTVLDAVTGAIPVLTPGRRRTASDATQTMVYCREAAAGLEVRYRRRYL